MRTRFMIGAAALVAIALAATGCVRVELPRGTYAESSESVTLQGATEVQARINMGAGQLDIGSADTDLMKADFGYSHPSWEPEVKYAVKGAKGDLSISTPEKIRIDFGSENTYDWSLGFSPRVPLDLTVYMGAGEATLDLAELDIRTLQVDVGAGDTTIDLSGDRLHHLTGTIDCGVGALTLKVPENVGVRIVGYRDGVGRYQADGFMQAGDALVNPAYENADVKLDLVLRRGVGEVVIEMVP